MEKLNASFMVKEAREKLAGRNTLPLTAIHTGVTVGAALAITLLQYVLAAGIGGTGGLSGMGTRSLLETLQTVLQLANVILLPFWNLGFLYVAMQWARGRESEKETLLTGFYRVGPCLGLLLNRSLLMIAVMFLCINVSSMLYVLTPAAARISEMAMETGGDMNALYEMMAGLSQAQLDELMRAAIPLLVIWLVLCAVILIPLLYRFRLAEYVILDQKGVRALPAMLISGSLLRRRCWQLFRVDLKLWWYYGLKALCLGLCYGDLLLRLLGVPLPMGEDLSYLLFYLLYLAALFGVEVAFRPQVETVYAGVYDAVMEKGPAAKAASAKPEKMPWDT